jgi:hypothetical protein
MSRPVIPVQDEAFIEMRREAFSEQSLSGYNNVVDQIFANILATPEMVDRETYGVAKKFVMYICALATAEVMPVHAKAIPTFETFLFLLLRFCTMPSLWISMQALTLWRNFLLYPSAQTRLNLPSQQLGTLLSMSVDRLVDFEDLLEVPEWSSYALFLSEDFDNLDFTSNGLFKQFLEGVRRVLTEIIEGVVAKECENGLKYVGDRLAHYLEVDRLDQRDLDGTFLSIYANIERGVTRKTSPAYVSACCVFRAVSAANIGAAMYLDRFQGTDEEKKIVYAAIKSAMTIWGKLIAGTEISDPRIWARQLGAYTALWRFTKDQPELIPMISKVSR